MRIYLDHNATAPVREEVAEAVARALRELVGNPSSVHAEGAAARRALEAAREPAAALVGVRPDELVFTSGATESAQTALAGVLEARAPERPHLVLSAVEHPAVAEPAAALEAAGYEVTRVPVSPDGRLDPGALAEAVSERTALVSVIHGHNETGVLQPVRALAEAAHARGAWLHLDATQAVGQVAVDAEDEGFDLLSASGHKIGGPKGTGLLALRRGVRLAPRQRGGPQERGRRAGTENLPGLVGLGRACALALAERRERAERWGRLRDRLWEGLRRRLPEAERVAAAAPRLPNTLLARFPELDGAVLVEALDLEGVAASAGAACASGSVEPSPALLALGLAPEEARSAVRFSVGHGVDAAQVDRVAELLPALVARVRGADAA